MNKETLKTKFRKVKQVISEKAGHVKEHEKTLILGGEYSVINVNYDIIRFALKTTVKHLQHIINDDLYKQEPYISYWKQIGNILDSDIKDIENIYFKKLFCITVKTIYEMSENDQEFNSNILESLLPKFKQFIDEFASLDKCMKELEDVRINIDECKSRLVSIKKGAATLSSSNVPVATIEKIKNVEQEFLEWSDMFEKKEDNMILELLEYIVKNRDIAFHYLYLMKLQSFNHKSQISTLNEGIKEIEDVLLFYSFEPLFGMSLENINDRYGQEISVIIECCLKFLYQNNCFEETGLFRVGSQANKVKILKNDLNSGNFDLNNYKNDLHVVTSVLKLYLSELPETLFPTSFGEEIIKISGLDKTNRLIEISKIMSEIPEINAKNILFLVSFFYVMKKHEKTTKMSANSISIVVAPNLLRGTDIYKEVQYMQASTIIFTDLIENFKLLYPEWYETNIFMSERFSDDIHEKYY